MKKCKKLTLLCMAALCLLGTSIFASAAPATSSKAAGEFGTIRGYLGDSWAQVPSGVLQYGFTYNTTVTKSPSSTAKIYASVNCVNNSTGATIWNDRAQNSSAGGTYAGYTVDMDHFNNIRNITVGVFGSHEARYTNAYGVYTNKTYNLYRDHGIK